MGRLDDAAKRKVVELRKAGLSFRKIKAVLELENIKVSAQAIYLFLKEFQGRNRSLEVPAGNREATQCTTGLVSAREIGISDRSGWSDQQLRSLLREASRVAGYAGSSEQSNVPSDSRGAQPRATGSNGASRDQQSLGEKEEDIRIVSVTSLAQHGCTNTVQSGVGSAAVTGALIRRRHTPSPALNPVLVARKRLLDKALFHKARMRESGQFGQQMAASQRRDQSSSSGADVPKAPLNQTATYDLTTPRPPHVTGIHIGGGFPRRVFQQRASLPVRTSPQQARVRLPNLSSTGTTPQGSVPTVQVQAPANQPSPSSQHSSLEAGLRNSLQEQVQCLGSEVRSLSLALRMMVEQQVRLEREQAQQTQVQKQILSTLQGLASRLGPCGLQHITAPTSHASCSLSSVSFNQSTFSPGQGTYSQCSQAQPRYSPGEIQSPSIEGMDAFTLDGLSPVTINGFQPCSTSDNLSFTHTQTQGAAYSQADTPTFSLSQTSHTQSYAGMENKTVEMPSTKVAGALKDCSPSTQSSSHPVSTCSLSPHEPQLNIIKVETVCE